MSGMEQVQDAINKVLEHGYGQVVVVITHGKISHVQPAPLLKVCDEPELEHRVIVMRYTRDQTKGVV